jgi:O-antigen/teichoic acid export membrane protein
MGIIRDMLKFAPSRVMPAIVGLISIPIITRLFRPDVYGDYILTMTTVGVLLAVVEWVANSIIRFHPAYEREKRLGEFYGTVFLSQGATVFALMALFLGGLFLARGGMSPGFYSMMQLGALVFVLFSIYDVLQEIVRSKAKIAWYSAFDIWRSVATFGIGLWLILSLGFHIDGLLWGAIFSLGLVAPCLWVVAMRGFPLSKMKYSRRLVGEMAHFGTPLVAGQLAGMILGVSDRYILKLYTGGDAVGVYSAAYVLCEKSVMLMASLFMLTSSTRLYTLWERHGEPACRDYVRSMTRYQLILGIPAVVGLSVLAKPILVLLVAPEYQMGYRIVPLIAAGAFCLGLQQRFQAGYLLHKKTATITLAIVIAGIVNLALNFLFVPRYGYMAAAWTTLGCYGVLLAMMAVFSRRFFVWEFPFASLWRVVASSALMGAGVHFLNGWLHFHLAVDLVICVIVGVASYFSLLFVFGERNHSNRELQDEDA